MPANLPPEYYQVEARYRAAKTPEEKRDALKEMIARVPKHKGTEKLRVDLKRRLAKLEGKIAQRPKTGRASPFEHIEREGAGQVVLVGAPNAGKSTLVDRLTHAQPVVADYPFSTVKPVVGMMPFSDIQIQLIDLPPVSEEYTPSWTFNLIRYADLIAWVVDLADDPEMQLFSVLELLKQAKIRLVAEVPELEEDGFSPIFHKRTLLVGTKLDLPGASDNIAHLFEEVEEAEAFPTVWISTQRNEDLERLKLAVFDTLRIVRVYTKKPGQPPDRGQPYVLPQGSTVWKVAEAVHRELADSLKFARLWGSGDYDGQRVARDHVVEDGDIIELH
ncbi:MAG: GTPase [Candidatus Bipolaricaulia bacterium]